MGSHKDSYRKSTRSPAGWQGTTPGGRGEVVKKERVRNPHGKYRSVAQDNFKTGDGSRTFGPHGTGGMGSQTNVNIPYGSGGNGRRRGY